jgi:hypothetical protein
MNAMETTSDSGHVGKALEKRTLSREEPPQHDDLQYPTLGRTLIVVGCLYLTMFLVALVSSWALWVES